MPLPDIPKPSNFIVMQLSKKLLGWILLSVSFLTFTSFSVISDAGITVAKNAKRNFSLTVIKSGQLTCASGNTFLIQTLYSSQSGAAYYSDATGISACGGTSYTSPYLMDFVAGTRTINVSAYINASSHAYYYVCAYVNGLQVYKSLLQEYNSGASYPLYTFDVPLTSASSTLEVRFINL